MSYRDVIGRKQLSTMGSSRDLLTQGSTLFGLNPPATSSQSPRIQPSLTVYDSSAILMDGPPGHAAISICPRDWWEEEREQPERTPSREEEWPNRLFSSLPPLQSAADLAPGSAPELYQAPNQTDFIGFQDIFQPPTAMTGPHAYAARDLLPVNQKLYLATCGDNHDVQIKIYDEFVRLQSLTGQPRDLATPDDRGMWNCAIQGCGQRPQRQWDLAAHYLKHMDGIQKPWACVCGKFYARNGDLRRHQKSCAICQSKSDKPIPNLAAECGPNAPYAYPAIPPIGGSQYANGARFQQMHVPLPLPPSLPSSVPSPYVHSSHIFHQSPNAMLRPFNTQHEWAPTQNNGPIFSSAPGVRRASNAGADANANNGNNVNGINKTVKERVPIEVRRPVYMSGFETLSKEQREATPDPAHADMEKGRGHLAYTHQVVVTHKPSVRSTALVLGLLFLAVSSVFAYQLYRTLS